MTVVLIVGFAVAAYALGVWRFSLWLKNDTDFATAMKSSGTTVSGRLLGRIAFAFGLFWPFALSAWAFAKVVGWVFKLVRLIFPRPFKKLGEETKADIAAMVERGGPSGKIAAATMDQLRAGSVSEIRVELVIDGKRRTAIFTRREKINELMLASDPVRDFLQSIAAEDQDALEGLQ